MLDILLVLRMLLGLLVKCWVVLKREKTSIVCLPIIGNILAPLQTATLGIALGWIAYEPNTPNNSNPLHCG